MDSNTNVFGKSMEEVWNHINPLLNTQHVQPTPNPHFDGLFFQDYSLLPHPTHCQGPEAPPMKPVTAVDRRNKRLIKGRESAVRSRARKKAYVEELEIIVEDLQADNKRLKDENEKLKKQHRQLDRKEGLLRTTTAPF